MRRPPPRPVAGLLVQLFAQECKVDTTMAATEASLLVADDEKRQDVHVVLGARNVVEGEEEDDDEEEEEEEEDSEGIETLLVDKVINVMN